MKHLNRYKYHMLAAMILAVLLLAGVRTKVAQAQAKASELPRVQSQNQMEHALELFPRNQQGQVLSLENGDQRPYLLSYVEKALPEEYQDRAFEITRAVIKEANHQHMDPMFLLAVIQTESQFNLAAKGSHGEIGLMQILPKTAQWMAAQAGMNAEQINLEDPAMNIRIGAAYFAQLRKSFKGRGTRYVSAYNMGSSNVRRLVKARIEPNIYAAKVMANYADMYLGLNVGQEVREVASSK